MIFVGSLLVRWLRCGFVIIIIIIITIVIIAMMMLMMLMGGDDLRWVVDFRWVSMVFVG